MKTSRICLGDIKVEVKDLRELKVLGLAEQEERVIEIHSKQPSHEFLNTAIHEMLHCILPDASEQQITKAADIMADKLWKLNYRRIQK